MVMGILWFPAFSEAQSSLVNEPLFSQVSFDTSVRATAAPVPIPILTLSHVTRQAAKRTWNGLVLGGFNSGFGMGAGFGFAVGGGMQMNNLAGREEFALQIDGLYSNAGGCDFCDAFTDQFDFSINQIAISGAFLYRFKETSSGWRPFAGGGLVFNRFSYDFDDVFDACDIVDCSVMGVGAQIQGGVEKGKLHVEGRVQGTVGGAFIALVGYKFGGGS
jgi:hypothetical protein